MIRPNPFRSTDMDIEPPGIKDNHSKQLLRKTKRELIDRLKLLHKENCELRCSLDNKDLRIERLDQLGAVLEASIFEIFVIDNTSRKFIYANKRARDNLGYTIEDINRLHLFDVKKDYDEEHFNKILEPINKGVLDKLEYCTHHFRKDGSSYPVEVHLHPSTYNKTPVYVTINLDISKRRHAEDKLRETLAQLEKINRYEAVVGIVTRTVHKSMDLKSVMENAVQALGKNMEAAEKVSIFLVEGTEAVMYAHRGYPQWFVEKVRRLQFPSGFTWRAIIHGTTIYVPDTDADSVMGPWAGSELGKKSYVAIPLKDGGRVVGVLNINSTVKDAFRADELRVLDIVSKQIEIAINKARFTESLIASEKALEEKIKKLSKKERYEKIINTIATKIHSSVDLHRILQLAVVNMKRNIAQSDLIAVYFVEGDKAVLKASVGHPEWFLSRVKEIPYKKGLTWKTIAEGRTCYVSDSESENVIGPAGREIGLKSYISMPIKSGKDTIGCINVASFNIDAFSREEISLLESVVKQIETALINAKYVEEIKSNEKRLKALVGSVDEIVFEFDEQGTYLGIWTENEELLIKPKEALLGKRIHDFFNRQQADTFVDTIRRVIKEQKSEIVEYTVTLKNGERCFRARINPIIPSINGTKTLSMLSRDVTESKALESMLLRAQRLDSVGKLAGGIAHDLNNILQPILMSVQLLGKRTSDEKFEKWLGIIENSTRRGSELIKQILSFARGLESEKRPFEIKYLIQDAEKIMKGTFPKSINVHINIKNNLPTIRADHTQLNQVLMNLCVNARDAMPDGGDLYISADTIRTENNASPGFLKCGPNEYLVIEVTDTGTGISPGVMDHIFDPFFTTKEPDEGTGLGLSTAYGIVKEHDGFINVDSVEGKGSTFTVYIPAIESRGETDSPGETNADLTKGNGEVILVVDDETMITDMIRTVLEEHGYKVLVAHNGVEATDLFLAHKDDVYAAVVDMMMPVMGGKATIRNLRSQSRSLKIIVISGYQDEHVLVDVEADAFLPKPFNTTALLRTLNDVIH